MLRLEEPFSSYQLIRGTNWSVLWSQLNRDDDNDEWIAMDWVGSYTVYIGYIPTFFVFCRCHVFCSVMRGFQYDTSCFLFPHLSMNVTCAMLYGKRTRRGVVVLGRMCLGRGHQKIGRKRRDNESYGEQ
jgi:hypothetical protein